METDQDTDMSIINEALEHLEPSSTDEIIKDIQDANNIKKKNSTLKKFLNTHSIKSITKGNCKQFDKDICLALKTIKDDFVPLLEIYNILTNSKKCYMLKKYFILKRNEVDSITNGKEIQKSDKPVITINLKPIYDESQYYSYIVKGMLNFISSNFTHSKLKLYFDTNIFKENYGYYKNNSDKFKNSLLTFVGQIKENLDLYKKDKERFKEKPTQTEKIEEKKIPENDFNDILLKADLDEDKTLLKIYKDAQGNNEIISQIKNLSMKKYSKIIVYMNEYNRFYAQINSLNAQVESLNKDKMDKDTKISDLNTQVESLSKDKIDKDSKISELNTQVESLNKDKIDKDSKISELNTQVESLNKDKLDKDTKISNLSKDKKAQEDKISNLQKKVDYMEVILNSLISRKVINHCIGSIVNKYKSSIKIIKKIIEENGKEKEISFIQVIDKINGVSVKQSQDLNDLLYEKRDTYNNCIHLDGKEKPFFVDDV